jgi:hypothetical protein
MSLGIPFYRLTPLLCTDVELDEKDEKSLVDMMWGAMAYVFAKREDVLQMKNLLCP